MRYFIIWHYADNSSFSQMAETVEEVQKIVKRKLGDGVTQILIKVE